MCGKGVEAAKVTALARYTIRAAAVGRRQPHAALRFLNDAMLQQLPGSERFITAAYVLLNQRRDSVQATVSLAGHPPALLRRADGTVETVGRPGTILGVFERPTLTNTRVSLHRGDALVLYTDGVTEARGDSGLYGDDPLRLLVAQPGMTSAAGLADRIEDAVLAFAGDVLPDDPAVLVIRVPTDDNAAQPAGVGRGN